MTNKSLNLAEKLIWMISYLALFYNSSSFLCSVNSSFGVFLMAVSVILLGGYYQRLKAKVSMVLWIFWAVILLNMALTWNVNTLGSCMRFILVLTYCCVFSYYIDFSKFINTYVALMTILTVIALLVHTLVYYFEMTDWLQKLPVFVNSNGVSVYSGILFNVYTYSYKRLTSIFWEPAIYATYTIFALIFELYFKKKISWIRVAVFLLGIFQSRSTGGYILFVLVGISALIIHTKSAVLQWGLFGTAAIGAGVLYLKFEKVLASLILWMPDVFSKLDVSVHSGSLSTRMDSGMINLTIFSQSPVFGVGMGSVERYYAALGGRSETSTITYFLAAFGVFGISYVLLYVYAFFRQKGLTLLTKLTLTAVTTLTALKEPYWFSAGIYVFFLLFLFHDITEKEIGRKKDYG